MTEDYYLAKWLSNNMTNFNVPDSLRLLQENLEWRKVEKMSTILDEDWNELNARFPYTRNTKDKSGRPLLYIDMSRWDIAKFLSEDESSADRFARYLVKMHEDSEAHVRELRKNGEKVTQFNLIINAAGYSTMKHACIQCMYLYRNVASHLTPHYPTCIERTVFLNVPYLFKMIYLFLGEDTQSYMSIYGQDRAQWEAMLLEYIDHHQFPEGILAQEVELSVKDNSEGMIKWNREL